MGLTGLEPVTLRLSSACSNQLSYRPEAAAEPPDLRFAIVDFRFGRIGAQARIYKNFKLAIGNRKSPWPPSPRLQRQYSRLSTTRAKTGGKGIRTPDFQLAKLALYQLSYAPGKNCGM